MLAKISKYRDISSSVKVFIFAIDKLTGESEMASKQECDKFASELERRFQEVMQWAIENFPDQGEPLSASDFADVRKELSRIGALAGRPAKREPEPSEGGPQYRSLNPAPWP